MSMYRRIKKQLLADKRKLTMMLMLGGFAMLLWGRLLLRNVPRTAVADPKANPTTRLAGADSKDASTTDKTPAKPAPVVYVNLFDRVSRDLFQFHDGFYPKEQTDEEPSVTQAKSADQTTDEQEQQRLRIEAVRQAAGQLKLQSTLLGRNSRALINGELLKPGQQINGFELIAVGPRQVTVRRDGVEVVLEMGE